MVKFNRLIHKETGTVIKYEDWLKAVWDDLSINVKFDNKLIKPNSTVKAKEMLFSDDFEIIYDSEFTGEELWLIHCRCGEDENLQYKVRDILKNRDELRYKYGIEVEN